MDYNKYPRPFEVGYYQPSPHFLAIPEHVAVMSANQGVIALCGPNDAESQEYARLFAAAPDLLESLEALVDHPYFVGDKSTPAVIRACAAIAKAKGVAHA